MWPKCYLNLIYFKPHFDLIWPECWTRTNQVSSETKCTRCCGKVLCSHMIRAWVHNIVAHDDWWHLKCHYGDLLQQYGEGVHSWRCVNLQCMHGLAQKLGSEAPSGTNTDTQVWRPPNIHVFSVVYVTYAPLPCTPSQTARLPYFADWFQIYILLFIICECIRTHIKTWMHTYVETCMHTRVALDGVISVINGNLDSSSRSEIPDSTETGVRFWGPVLIVRCLHITHHFGIISDVT